jgi:hypothetical protein
MDKEKLQQSQYQILGNRCMHELKVKGVKKAAQKMMMTS